MNGFLLVYNYPTLCTLMLHQYCSHIIYKKQKNNPLEKTGALAHFFEHYQYCLFNLKIRAK